jgi:hypothetical protein
MDFDLEIVVEPPEDVELDLPIDLDEDFLTAGCSDAFDVAFSNLRG